MTKDPSIHLGFEVGTGMPVSIPIRNMVVTGQTQEAGKTTTLEALIERATVQGFSGLAFITKRGEGALRDARKIPPYFRDRADWQFVASLLEATMRERMKFERAWIIKAAAGARTLADVHANVKRLRATSKGLSESVYTTLDAYLDIVVPRLQRIQWAQQVELAPGLNAMDISERETYPSEVQALIIRAVLEWMYERARKTISVLPEAWEFLPQERGSPVKLAATELIRKGSTLRNHIWLDSQDIGGVDKTFLRSCPVWLLGVQRERNEIERTLDAIPAGTKRPKPEEIATLDQGVFFACYSKTVIKTYVQPAWMSRKQAETIAVYLRDDPVHAHDLQRDAWLAQHEPADRPQETRTVSDHDVLNALKDTNSKLDQLAKILLRSETAPPAAPIPVPIPEVPVPAAAGPSGFVPSEREEQLYRYFLERLSRESPTLLRVALTVPEIEVQQQRHVIQADASELFGMIAILVAEGFLDQPTKGARVHAEVKRRFGYKGNNSGRSNEQLDKLVKMGFVTNEPDGYQAVPHTKRNIRKVEK